MHSIAVYFEVYTILTMRRPYIQTLYTMTQVLLHARNLEDARTTLESALRLPGVRERGATSAGGLTPQDRYCHL
jgi:hypothetical protein